MDAAGAEAEGRSFVLLGDQPYEGSEDPLGFDAIVGDLAALILRSRASSPFTLGIEAAWGMGKSTLMTRLCARLGEEKDVTPVMFNAWTADNGAVLEGLMKSVLHELDPNALRRALRNHKLIGWARLVAGMAAGYLGLGSAVDSLWDRVGADPRARNGLRKLVEEAVGEWRDEQPELSDDRLLCVFIDDLDRCSPEGVLDVFEAMKLYLDVPGIVFVVGYDQDIVSDLILEKKGYSSEAIKSRDYLEKFIQIVYRIPRSAKARSGVLVDTLLESSRTAELFGDVEREIMIEGSESNPRRIKRFINGFVLAYGLDSRWRDFEPQVLVRAQLLQMYFREFAILLERPSEKDPIKEFLEYRRLREILRRHDQEERTQIQLMLREMGLAAGDQENYDSILTRLEANAQVAFASVVEREDFASLVESIASAPDWPKLRVALVEGALLIADAGDELSPAEGPSLDGLRILWVDDNGAANAPLAEAIRERGAELVEVATSSRLGEQLKAHSWDVVISDIDRDGDPDQGLAAIEMMRDGGLHLPRRVIFYVGRITSARMDRAHQLRADLTMDPKVLLELLEKDARALKSPYPGQLKLSQRPSQSFPEGRSPP